VGRPRKVYSWDAAEAAYVYGEKSPEAPETAMPVFPSMDSLGARFGIPHGTITVFAKNHEWVEKRKKARPEILALVHQAMCRAASEAYVSIRTGVVAVLGKCLARVDVISQGDNVDGAVVIEKSVQTAIKVLKGVDAAMGIQQPPAIAIQNNLFTQPSNRGEEPPPPAQAPALIDPALSGSIWSLILRAREAASASSDGYIASLEEESPLPAHLSMVPRGS
jgi:hypothetical protein